MSPPNTAFSIHLFEFYGYLQPSFLSSYLSFSKFYEFHSLKKKKKGSPFLLLFLFLAMPVACVSDKASFASTERRPKSCPAAAPCTGMSATPASSVPPRGSLLPTRGSHRWGCCLFRQREAATQGRRQRVLRASGGVAQRLLGHSV